ncbi:tetratricopeptide repeat protein [Tuwongella immobilis]|uniref:Secreted protein: Uncharacterized protein n=1 Tax=Tuwongella immobilis TaxID=692036 RepID=A0A6C2YP48_9BACT|nr:hypothetical protein [Tuwongella immobilis]VIP03398.1 secreted protein : Uncharacterized protein OS=Singulisphaera acidiphila (strain ATCC BAA-1392 / DSM 18658 / VKM B-2454 / MOB10) GN=Sinac_1021 PE=4 SV=1 [Tuwongella immobilis]VTS04168.1 secreted protein : Uncharacterized protein OS=Singulisphaera acidiphila (strain ATCC BAA-1392 / DSM 18658 / VKM B-2454 / MOB10) GN=Sinac_1021 PE=4 SV=1 [Tuwongella immobilis]
MRQLFGMILGLGILGLVTLRGQAETPPYFDFVESLRQSGQSDLALEYLEKLAKEKPTGVQADLLPVELARTRLQLVPTEPEESERVRLIDQARREFEGFLKSAPNHPERPQVLLEVARLLTQQGKTQAIRARRIDEEEERLKAFAAARPFFDQAAKQYQEAAKTLKQQVSGLGEGNSSEEKARVKRLRQAALGATIDQGINEIERALTFAGEGDRRTRGDQLLKAAKLLDDAGQDEDLPLSWVAKAWIVYCLYETDSGVEADRAYRSLIGEERKRPAASDGIRLAKFFNLRQTARNGAPGFELEVQKAADAWLNQYRRRSDRLTMEGLGVQYILAGILRARADKMIKRDPKTGLPVSPPVGDAQSLLNRAASLYQTIASSDNEYSERAVRNRINIVIDQTAARADDPSKLTTFEQCYLAAQVEQALLNQKAKMAASSDATMTPEQVEALRKSTYTKIISLIDRGIRLATPKESKRDLLEAQFLQTFAYVQINRPMEAAVLGEHLARANPRSGKAAQIAMLALNAYNTARSANKEAAPEDLQADLNKIIDLARYMDRTFPTDPLANVARHQLGFYLMRLRDYFNAADALARITTDYASLNEARRDLGAAIFMLNRPPGIGETKPNIPEAQRLALMTRAIEAIQKLPPATKDTDGEIAKGFAEAKIQLGQVYLLDPKTYADAERLGDELAKLIPTLSIAESDRDNLTYAARAVKVGAVFGQAQRESLSPMRDLAKIAERLAPELKDAEAEIAKTDNAAPSRESLLREYRKILVLALRTSVQDSKVERANEILQQLQKAGGSIESTIDTLREVVRDVRGQITELKKQGKSDEADKMATSFTELLDQIAKSDKLPETMLLFLSTGYGSIDVHAKSVELLERIAPPAADADEDKVKSFRKVQFLLAQAYRKAKEYQKAQTLINQMLGTAKQKGWAFASVEVRKESLLLLEDQGKWRDAVTGWTSLARVWQARLKPLPKERIAGDPNFQRIVNDRAMYFDLFVETQRCLTRANDSTLKDEMKKGAAFEKIAAALVELETKNEDLSDTLKDSIRALLEEYPLLKEKYLAAGGKLISPKAE